MFAAKDEKHAAVGGLEAFLLSAAATQLVQHQRARQVGYALERLLPLLFGHAALSTAHFAARATSR